MNSMFSNLAEVSLSMGSLASIARINYLNSYEAYLGKLMSYLIYFIMKIYDFLEIILIIDIKRRTTKDELVCKDTYRPKINFLIVSLTLQNLRRKIQGSPTKSCPEISWVHFIDSPSKITKLNISLD